MAAVHVMTAPPTGTITNPQLGAAGRIGLAAPGPEGITIDSAAVPIATAVMCPDHPRSGGVGGNGAADRCGRIGKSNAAGQQRDAGSEQNNPP
jgi:hypothetical protein